MSAPPTVQPVVEVGVAPGGSQKIFTLSAPKEVGNRGLAIAPAEAPEPSLGGKTIIRSNVLDSTHWPKLTPKHWKGPTAPPPGDAQWGTHFPYTNTTGNTGVYAGQSAYTTLDLPTTTYVDGVWLYAPTLYGADDCPLEVATVYHRFANGSTKDAWLPGATAGGMERFVGLWDHTNLTYVRTIRIDNDFVTKYVRNIADHYDSTKSYDLYFVKIERVSNTWRAYIYNYSNLAWEDFNGYSRTNGGTAAATGGWNQFETYYFQISSVPCPNLPDIRGQRAQQLLNGVWSYATNPGNSMGSTQLQCPTGWNANKTYTHNYDDWLVP